MRGGLSERAQPNSGKGGSDGMEGWIYQNTADDVAQMRHVVDIGEGAGDQDVVLARHGGRRFPGCAHGEMCCDVTLVVVESLSERAVAWGNGGVLFGSNFSPRCPANCLGLWASQRWGDSWGT